MSATRTKLLALLVLWGLMLAVFAVAVPDAFRPDTLRSVLQFSTILALVTLGQSLVVLAGGGGIDLSVGGAVALAGLAMAWLGQLGGPALGIAAALVAGLLLGAFNGWLVTRVRLVPLIATLGTFYVYGGLAIALTDGRPVGGIDAALAILGRGTIGPLPIHFLAFVLPLFLVAALLLHATSWGSWLLATGGNETAARLTGVPVDRLRLVLYAVSGGLAGLAAVVANAWLLSARPNIGQNLELESLTAALLGGIAIQGGHGSVLGPLVAVLFLTTFKTGLQLANINTIWQVGGIGALLILSVLADRPWKGRG